MYGQPIRPTQPFILQPIGGPFPQILHLFQGLKICLWETSIFKIIMTDVFFMVKARIYMVSLLDFINSTSQTDDI